MKKEYLRKIPNAISHLSKKFSPDDMICLSFLIVGIMITIALHLAYTYKPDFCDVSTTEDTDLTLGMFINSCLCLGIVIAWLVVSSNSGLLKDKTYIGPKSIITFIPIFLLTLSTIFYGLIEFYDSDDEVSDALLNSSLGINIAALFSVGFILGIGAVNSKHIVVDPKQVEKVITEAQIMK